MRRQQRKEAGRGGNQVTGTDDEQSGENTPLNRPAAGEPDAGADGKGDVEMRSGAVWRDAPGSGEGSSKETSGVGVGGGGGSSKDVPPDSGVAQEGGDAADDAAAASSAAGAGGGGRRNRGLKKPDAAGDGDIESNTKKGDWMGMSMSGPFKVLEPIRTDPVKLLQTRKNRLERYAVQGIPEIHFVGQISSGTGLIDDSTEGVCLR